jgi:hypothetical protein
MIIFPDFLRMSTLIASTTLVDMQVLNATGWRFDCIQKKSGDPMKLKFSPSATVVRKGNSQSEFVHKCRV